MKLATKTIALQIADEMSSADHGVNLNKKTKRSIFQIAKKIAKKVVKNNKQVSKVATQAMAHKNDNHQPIAPKPITRSRTKPRGLKV